jgi:hypothetical protein
MIISYYNEMTSVNPFDDLPIELCVLISECLPITDIVNLHKTCKLWHHIIGTFTLPCHSIHYGDLILQPPFKLPSNVKVVVGNIDVKDGYVGSFPSYVVGYLSFKIVFR